MSSELEAVLREDLFPGNCEAFSRLAEEVAGERLSAFVGAGASAPLVPTWTNALQGLTDQAKKTGQLSSSDHRYLSEKLASNPLEAADELEEVYTKQLFRSRISDLFHSKEKKFTQCGRILMEIPFSGMITTNYDYCLTHAYIQHKGHQPDIFCSDSPEHLIKWTEASREFRTTLPILHLHGVYDRTRSMIFTGRDYDRFYLKDKNHQFIEELWKNAKILAIGFSFSDPFLRIFSSHAVASFDIDNRHFALIGHRAGGEISRLQRKNFESRYRLRPIFYQIATTANGDENHEDLLTYLNLLGARFNNGQKPEGRPLANLEGDSHPAPRSLQGLSQKLKEDFENCLSARGNGVLYVDPRIMDGPRQQNGSEGRDVVQIAIEDIVNSDQSYIIHAGAECGGTTLARRLAYELSLRGNSAQVRDATTLPNYRAKLVKEFPSVTSGGASQVLVIDNFSFSSHDRLLKELLSLGLFSRVIIISKVNHFEFMPVRSPKDFDGEKLFTHLYLWTLNRSDIRILAEQLIETADNDLITQAVDKVYRDLLSLCIPLTPANVLMYLQVLCREQNFDPLNRVQIVDRYISGLLRSPGELFNSTFTAKSKIELLCQFSYNLYSKTTSKFTLLDWLKFTKEYSDENLVEFNEKIILDEFIRAKIFVEIGGVYYFKYRFFYSFFVCKYISARPEILSTVIDSKKYMSIYASVEVLSSLSVDNTKLVLNLCDNLENALAEFEKVYFTGKFDPVAMLRWPRNRSEKDKIWEPVAELIEKGPADHKEIDAIKSRFLDEIATEDQNTRFARFDEFEQLLVGCYVCLRQALVGADDLDGKLKLRAIKTLLRAYHVFFQLAFVLTPMLIRIDYFNWAGMLFVTNRQKEKEDFSNIDYLQFALNWVPSIADSMRETVGTRKLGPVYRKLLREQDIQGFPKYLAIGCLIRSKPSDWASEVEKFINEAPAEQYLLYLTLEALLNELQNEVNTIKDRSEMKALIARMQAKRVIGTDKKPSQKSVKKTLLYMDKNKLFDLEEGTAAVDGPADVNSAARRGD